MLIISANMLTNSESNEVALVLDNFVFSVSKVMNRTAKLMEDINQRMDKIESNLNKPKPEEKSIEDGEKKKEKDSKGEKVKEVSAEGKEDNKEKSKDKEKDKDKDKDKDNKSKEKEKSGDDGKEKSKKDKKDVSNADGSKKEPVKVYVSYKVNCVSDISAILSTFEVDIKIFYYWVDAKLIGKKKNSDVDFSEDKTLFNPDVVITNEHNLEERSRTVKVNNPKTGEVKCSLQYNGTVFMTSMDLKFFPFDCQNLQVCIKPYKLPIEECILVARPAADCALDHHVAHEWELLGHCMKIYETDPMTSSVGKVYSTLYITVLCQRQPNWFVNNIFIPSCCFLGMSWLSYFMDASNHDGRLGLVLNTVMASIANKYVVGDSLPKVNYKTLADVYIDYCFYLQAITILMHSIITKFQNEPLSLDYLPYTCALDIPGAVLRGSANFLGDWLNTALFAANFIAGVALHVWIYATLAEHNVNIEAWKAGSVVSTSSTGTSASPQKSFKAQKEELSVLATAFETAKVQVVKLVRDWFPQHQSVRDASHFTNFGAAAVIAGIMGDKDPLLVEEKAWVKKSKELKTELSEDLDKLAAGEFKRVFQSSRLKKVLNANEEDETYLQNAAAVILQTMFRTRLCRRKFYANQVKLKRSILERSARKIQRLFLHRKAVRRMMLSMPIK